MIIASSGEWVVAASTLPMPTSANVWVGNVVAMPALCSPLASGITGATVFVANQGRFHAPTLLATLVDHIIPRSDTPGAADANVHYFIDWTAFTNAKRGAQLRKDLSWIAKRNFAKSAAQWLRED